jgi:hypothetical protein
MILDDRSDVAGLPHHGRLCQPDVPHPTLTVHFLDVSLAERDDMLGMERISTQLR